MPRVGKTLLKKMSGAPGYCDDNRALFAFEGAGSMRITEVAGETCLTSVKSEQAGGLEEQNLRKWGEKSALLP